MTQFCSECTYLEIDNFNEADLYGKFYCEKRLERHGANEYACDRFCKAYSRSSNVSNSAYEYSKYHGSSGCYLTTIICKILGFNDNCIYLNKMRNFRTNVLQKDEKYKRLLVEYDIIGPKISKFLENDPLNKQIALNCFNRYIVPIINYIDTNKDMAISEYINMTNMLKGLYNINLEVDNKVIENAKISESGHGVYVLKSSYN